MFSRAQTLERGSQVPLPAASMRVRTQIRDAETDRIIVPTTYLSFDIRDREVIRLRRRPDDLAFRRYRVVSHECEVVVEDMDESGIVAYVTEI